MEIRSQKVVAFFLFVCFVLDQQVFLLLAADKNVLQLSRSVAGEREPREETPGAKLQDAVHSPSRPDS